MSTRARHSPWFRPPLTHADLNDLSAEMDEAADPVFLRVIRSGGLPRIGDWRAADTRHPSMRALNGYVGYSTSGPNAARVKKRAAFHIRNKALEP